MKTNSAMSYSVIGLVLLLGGCGSQSTGDQAAKSGEESSQTATAAENSSSEANANSDDSAATASQPSSADSASQTKPTTQSSSSANATKPASVSAPPATVKEAAERLDLRTFPVAPGTEDPANGSLAQLSYQTKSSPVDVYKFVKEKLAAQKWEELPGSNVSDDGANATFARDGYKVSFSAFKTGGPDGKSHVSLSNHGNLNIKQLPVPDGAKPLYDTPVSTAYMAEASVDETFENVSKTLLAQGWTPYGEASNSHYFKKNAVQLNVDILSAPAQGGKTMLTYSSKLLSADIPLPANAEKAQFSDMPTQLFFDLAGDFDVVATFYRDELAKQGWEATTDNFVEVGFYKVLIFRNPAKDLMELRMNTVDDKTRSLVKFQTAAEVAAIEKALEEEMARKKAEANKPKPKLAIALPEKAANVKVSGSSIKFTLGIGEAKAAVEAMKKKLVESEWKVESEMFDAMFGTVTFKKENQSMSITYVETGVLAPEVTVTAIGVELEQAKEKK